MPTPGRKPRPALVLAVGNAQGEPYVQVAYGTSQRTTELHSGEFVISENDGEAYAVSGLSFPTKFNMRVVRDLPYTDDWFRVPPAAPYGQTPKLGVLHPSLLRRAAAAANAARRGTD